MGNARVWTQDTEEEPGRYPPPPCPRPAQGEAAAGAGGPISGSGDRFWFLAYPCGQTFVGRGRDVKSTIPLIAERFLTGRGWLGEDANDPEKCDPVQLIAMESDGRIFDQIKPLIDKAAAEGRWLILTGHEIGEGGFQTTFARTVEEICRYANDPANGVWIDTVGTIGRYIIKKRESPPPRVE